MKASSRAKTLEKKERRDYLHATLFAEGSDPFLVEDIPLPPPRTPVYSPKTRRSSPKPLRSSKRISTSLTPTNIDRKRGSRSPTRTLPRRKSPLSKEEEPDAPKNQAGKSRKTTRRFSMKPKKKDAVSVTSATDGSLDSKKSPQSDDDDRRKSIKTRSKSDRGSSKKSSSSPTPTNRDRTRGSQSPPRTMFRRKSLLFKGEEPDAPKNEAGKSRRMSRRFSMKSKKKDAVSVTSATDGSLDSKKTSQSDDYDKRKALKTRSKSDWSALGAMKKSLQISSDSESSSESEDEIDNEGPGLLSRGLNRLEQFYEEALG
jgi:hypothetical protein